jgi:hypothetical protein
MLLRTIACVAGAIILGSISHADLVLNANAAAWNHNDGLTFFNDPHSTTLTSGSGEAHSLVHFSDLDAFQDLFGTLNGGTGSLRMVSGWKATNLTAGQVRFWDSISVLTYETGTAGWLNLSYNSSVTGGGFGLANTKVMIDGAWEAFGEMGSAPTFLPPTSGTYSVFLDAGVHTLQFSSFSNIWGQLADRNQKIDDTVSWTFSGEPVPEPATLSGLLLLAGPILRRRRQKSSL